MTSAAVVSSQEPFAGRVVLETCQLLERLYGCTSVSLGCVDAPGRSRQTTAMTGYVSYTGSRSGAMLLRCSVEFATWMDESAAKLISTGNASSEEALGQFLAIVMSRALSATWADDLLLASVPAVVTGSDYNVIIRPVRDRTETGIEVRTEQFVEHICIEVMQV